MNTVRIEELLEQLIAKQDDIICRLEALESVIEEKLEESNRELENSNLKLEQLNSSLENSNYKLDSIHDELNWWEERPSLAKQFISVLDRIEVSIHNVEVSVSALDR